MTENVSLARRITLPLLILYGLGTILGAGIYVLVGKVAAVAGMLAPLSFILAALIAWLTAMSYSELVVLFPESAGEAVYVEESFHRKWLTLLVGLLIVLTGIVSAATLANGFTGYFVLLVPMNETLAIIGVVFLLTILACWGIAESMIAAALVTALEVFGLLIVLFFSADVLTALPQNFDQLLLPASSLQWVGVLSGTFLAFYAFIGFEDMVNVVEEVREPEKTMPKAILWVVIISTAFYVLIALVAILSLPLEELARSEAPLAEILAREHEGAAKLVSIISVFAIVNGVLIQMIMASRVSYGMSKRYGGPSWLHRVSSRTQTPVLATLIIGACILGFSLFFPLLLLAKFTSFIILTIFALVNVSLWKLHGMQDRGNATATKLRSYPLVAALLCAAMLVFQVVFFSFQSVDVL